MGGGKSDALLMAALQYTDQPEYVALILRSTYKDLSLPGAIMDRAKEWLIPIKGIKWHEADKTFTFPSGARLVFGHLDGPNDHFQYQSANFHFVGIDEMAQLRWYQVKYMFSRLRRAVDCQIPIRFRGASNPGGICHEDIKARYIDPRTREAIFIPAGLDDNPHLDRVTYIKSLDQLDPITRKQLLEGDWDVTLEGGIFKRAWFQLIERAPDNYRVKWVRWWDLAATAHKPGTDPDYTVGALVGLLDGVAYVRDIVRARVTPGEVEKLVRKTAARDGRKVPVWMEQEPGSAGKAIIVHYKKLLIGYVFRGEPSTGPKEEYAAPLSSAAEDGNVKLVYGDWIADFLTEFVLFPNAVHDDQVDATSKAFAKLTGVRARCGTWGKPKAHWRNRHHKKARIRMMKGVA